MLINEFYANREIFLTGGTGFLGKALIEKLLRDSTLKVLYVLLRSKKSVSVEQRLEQLKKDTAFERIRQQCPEVLNKLHAIEGDSAKMGLGIQPADLKLLQNVSVIFHMAANVRFDDPLRSSILLNTRGTYELIKIAETLKNLVVFLHCSTAYCNPFEDVVEEKVYSMPVDWRKTIKIAETYDECTLNTLFYKYTGNYPNSYTFTKNLSEQAIQEYSNKLPMHIFRPSVVLNATKEPSEGWIDNLNGPIAPIVGKSIGAIPVLYCNGNVRLDLIPTDTVTRLTIVAAYRRGMQHLRKESIPGGLEVVNCVTSHILDLNLSHAAKLFDRAARENPMENSFWDYEYPIATGCYYNFILKIFLMNIPLAIFIDIILRCMGQKPMMVQLTRRTVHATKAVSFFSFKEFEINNDNMLALEDNVPQSELSVYGIKEQFFNLDVLEYAKCVVRGIKYYLFNQPRVATAGARKRAKILFIISRSIKYFTITLFTYYLWSIASKF